jgi:hypothetical protein
MRGRHALDGNRLTPANRDGADADAASGVAGDLHDFASFELNSVGKLHFA